VRQQDGRYANSFEADLFLDRSKPSYVGGLLDSANSRLYGVWGSLTAALQTGEPQCHQSAASNFAPIYADERSRNLFVSSLTAKTWPVAKALATRFPWNDYNVLIDIGTAQGCLPVEIAQLYPHLAGGGFDLPALRPVFESYVQQHSLSGRLRFYPGDFFR